MDRLRTMWALAILAGMAACSGPAVTTDAGDGRNDGGAMDAGAIGQMDGGAVGQDGAMGATDGATQHDLDSALPGDAATGCTPGAVCRPAAGPCDVPESCDDDGECPADGLEAAGTVCRAPAGPCDLDERCTGTSPSCPTDAFSPSTTECRSAAGGCDIPEHCSGSTADCPADVLASAGTVCREAAGDCDVAETCGGASPQCPEDVLAPATQVCRPATGECDLPESCTGADATCPADALRESGDVCRPAANECDVAESCTGSSAACPSDAFQPASTICTAASCSAGVAQPSSQCAGTSATCVDEPAISCNGYACDGTTCGTSCTPPSTGCLSTHFCQSGGLCAPKKANGLSCSGSTAGIECLSGTCRGFHVDSDGDGFGTGPIVFLCSEGFMPPPGFTPNNTDCCDSDDRAHPSQTMFFSTARMGCGGFDFDCNGSSDRQFTSGGACTNAGSCPDITCNGIAGYTGATAPACGVSAEFATSCSSTLGHCGEICRATTTSRRQPCR